MTSQCIYNAKRSTIPRQDLNSPPRATSPSLKCIKYVHPVPSRSRAAAGLRESLLGRPICGLALVLGGSLGRQLQRARSVADIGVAAHERRRAAEAAVGVARVPRPLPHAAVRRVGVDQVLRGHCAGASPAPRRARRRRRFCLWTCPRHLGLARSLRRQLLLLKKMIIALVAESPRGLRVEERYPCRRRHRGTVAGAAAEGGVVVFAFIHASEHLADCLFAMAGGGGGDVRMALRDAHKERGKIRHPAFV